VSDPKQNRFCPLKYHKTLLLCIKRLSLLRKATKFFLYTDKNVEHPTKLNISAQTKTTLLPYSADPIAGGVGGFPNSTAVCRELRYPDLADFLLSKFSRTICMVNLPDFPAKF
jgi:predicted amidohydrolase